jgi:hypothetical protein
VYEDHGDRLWVREKVALNMPVDQFPNGVAYFATDAGRCSQLIKWLPSIHMPRWASRLTLEITDVRVGRVQDITIDEIGSEGVQVPCTENGLLMRVSGKFLPHDYLPDKFFIENKVLNKEQIGMVVKAHFASLWDSINGSDSWKSNPWVWVIEFKRLEAA